LFRGVSDSKKDTIERGTGKERHFPRTFFASSNVFQVKEHTKVSPFQKKAQPRKFCFERVVFGQLVLGLASGLEAFSREPPCDSIGALATRQTPETSGMAWEFLSYYPKLPSRCLRDPPSYLEEF